MNQAVFSDRIKQLKKISNEYSNPLDLTRRVFLEEPSFSDKYKRDSEFEIKSNILKIFQVDYHQVFFCGSAHLGVSPIKGAAFKPGFSDLDIAIISARVFSEAFADLSASSKAFTDETVFAGRSSKDIDLFKQRIWKRGSIHLNDLPKSGWADSRKKQVNETAKKHRKVFSSVSVVFYLSEYFYCWKQKYSLDVIRKMGAK